MKLTLLDVASMNLVMKRQRELIMKSNDSIHQSIGNVINQCHRQRNGVVMINLLSIQIGDGKA